MWSNNDHYFPYWPRYISKSKLQEWLSFRDATLDEILRHDGLGDYLGQLLCCACNIHPGFFKCKDCSGGGRLKCQACVVNAHQDTPLHRIEVSYLVKRLIILVLRLSLIHLIVLAMDWHIFRQGIPQKSWSPRTIRSWGMPLPVSFPWASGIFGFWYLRHPSCECGLLWLPEGPERQHTRSKNPTYKAILVSCDVHETEYCLHVWPSWHVSWKYPTSKRKYLWFLSPTITENWQGKCFWHDCKYLIFCHLSRSHQITI